jgi:hypothetical protein
MGSLESIYRRDVVEQRQIVTESATVDFRALGINVGSTHNRRGRNRTWLFRPSYGKPSGASRWSTH